ncbi:hypothetical protein D1BOALGB6SA_10406 [Olavius sp. associated proteobacterium Delta 1]|nr:hypothetical protein D1BOALGB6SA_10406 [Olavius sp. associated proteobacterium Delta 1]
MENQIESLKNDKLRFDSWIEAAESERKCQDHSIPDNCQKNILDVSNKN